MGAGGVRIFKTNIKVDVYLTQKSTFIFMSSINNLFKVNYIKSL